MTSTTFDQAPPSGGLGGPRTGGLLLAVAAGCLGFIVLALLRLAGGPGTQAEAGGKTPSDAARQQALAAYGRLPLSFVANAGQLDSREASL
jgi:hypothetical protein